LSTGTWREAPVDNECFSFWQLGLGTLGTLAATGDPGIQTIGSWAWVALGTLGTQAATGDPGIQAMSSWA